MTKIPIKLIEDHDEAYQFWKRLKLQGKPLVHLDAHIDFNFHPAKPIKQTFDEAKSKKDLIKQLSTNLMYKELKIKEESLTNIGNYIYPAMRDGIITDFYWVIPGDRREFRKSLKNARNIARSFFPRDPLENRNISKEEGSLKVRIYGRDFVITTLDDLPLNLNEVLLDIDTDYLTTDTIRKAGAVQDAGRRFPWIWPEELINKLRDKNLKPSCITIAYSVNGGFTPLIYKFLGDEIAVFFKGTTNKLKDIILSKNNTLAFLKKGKVTETVKRAKELLQDLGNVKIVASLKNKLKAHLAFILFRCYTKLKNFSEARFYYNLAITSDKTYRVRDNNYGPLHLRKRGNVKKAEQEYRFVLSADKNNSYALSGLANIFMRHRSAKKARALFKKAYTQNRKNQEALLGISRAEILLKNYKMALKYLEDCKIKNRMPGSTVYSLKAQAFEGLGEFDKALEEYKLAHRFGIDLSLYLRLFRLLKKTGIPEEHKGWIESRIDSYKNYKRDFLKHPKSRRPTKQILKTRKATEILITRIDRLLEKVRPKNE